MKGVGEGAGGAAFEPDAGSEKDLWFLPAEEEPPVDLPPGPWAEGRRLFDPAEWRAA